MADYPKYIHQLLAEAAEMLAETDLAQAEAAAKCFEVLAWFPDHQAALALILQAFSQPQLIQENRKAIGRLIHEWDDRQWQQRRRLALSFRYMCRWASRNEDHIPADVETLLTEGKAQLRQDYLRGLGQGGEAAWHLFQDAFRRTQEPQAAMQWVGALYARQGYFAEAVEVLAALLAQFPKAEDAHRLWAEVRWWRDHQHQIPWIPPNNGGNGRLFQHIMAQTDPNFAANPEAYTQAATYKPPNSANLPDDFALPPSLPADITQLLEAILSDLPSQLPAENVVDWHYLHKLASEEIDISQFPEWAQYMLLELDDPQVESYLKQFLLSYLANPSLYGSGEV